MKCSIIIIMQIIACMISCAERDQMRQQTLKNLAMTDWGNTEVFVQIAQPRLPANSIDNNGPLSWHSRIV